MQADEPGVQAGLTLPELRERCSARVNDLIMNAIYRGAIGALTTNVQHEITRRITPEALGVDLLGMQARAKLIAAQTEPPTGRTLDAAALAGDLALRS